MDWEKSAEVIVGGTLPKDRSCACKKQAPGLDLSGAPGKSPPHLVPPAAVLGGDEVEQGQTVISECRVLLHTRLMERVVDPSNLNRAYGRVVGNKGAPGCDGMTVADLRAWVEEHQTHFLSSLLDGSYQPQPVRGVQIPKASGGLRQLGIPPVVDRLVQQAIAQVLSDLFDPTFSASSYGFRPGRSAHDALRAASSCVAEGRGWVVDLDLEQFFDRVNHDILMSRLARRVNDKRLLRLIRRFLEAGLMQGGICVMRREGTPQGGPLSPLLANLLLDDLDKELERRGHRFCRYADDCNIYVGSAKAGERVMQSVTDFLEGTLKLRVNRVKSAVARPSERKFLGYRILAGGRLTIAPKSVESAKTRIRQITRRTRGRSLPTVIRELNQFTNGWVAYYRLAAAKTALRDLDQWIRRRLRCIRLKQLKRARTIAAFLRKLGCMRDHAWAVAASGKGWWRKAKTQATHRAMDLVWLQEQGLRSMHDRWMQLNQAQ
ncbi:group II intron reverse transcriptase/maturase [Thiohalocapsa sp.]|uniref:group II intron reverse transcriptase/maturase n=1 Tax=Thiohalocapsa sp. TaxID=2497641 RepID=UPI0025F1FE65|nr:group II intron reverse transcriptase/maturase [Thiohalocapsa sp.]